MPGNAPQLGPRGPLTSPPPWWEEGAGARPGEGAPEASSGSSDDSPLPGEGWPSITTVEYMTKLITLCLILLAVPWLLGQLLSSPKDGARNAASVAGLGRVVA